MGGTVKFKVYYDTAGRILHYSMEDLPGVWIEVTPEQYSEMRMDATVQDGKLVYTHQQQDIHKLVPVRGRKSPGDTLCSKYDVNIIIENSNNYNRESPIYWTQAKYAVKR